ncbi:MAG TPA: T9SS type A sorting domain-containing protein [Chitinophagaceae bacterium]
MKQALLVVIVLFFLLPAFATTYYSTGNMSPNSTANWRTNRNGTGSSPSNFNSNNDIFIIQSGHTVTTTANWTVGGNNAKIIIESGAVLQANHKVAVDIFQADATGKYVHNDNSSAFPGSDDRIFNVNSTVEINNWSGSTKLPENTTWGNLIIDVPGFNSNMSQGGDLTDIAGDFIIRSTGNSGREFRLAGTQDYTLTIGGDLVIEGGLLEASSGNGNADQKIIINGSFIQSGGEFTRSNNNSNALVVEFNSDAGNFTKSGGTLTNTYINWKVNASKKLILNNDLAVASSRSFTVNGTLDLANRNISGQGSFVVNTGARLISSNTQGLNGALTLTGGLTFSSGVSFEFLAATTTPFPSVLSSVAAANFVTGANVTLNKNVTISATLTLTSGKLIIPAGNTVTVSSGNAIAGSGFNAAKHIETQVNNTTGSKGYFRIQNFTGARTIPVGNGTYYLPATLTATGTNDFTLCVFIGITTNGEPNGTAFTATQKKDVVDAVWHINRNAGSAEVMLQFAWPATLEGSDFQNFGNSLIGVSHYGTYWEPAFGTGDQVLNTATRTGVVTFSPFAVAKGSVPLPIRFGDIKAVYKNSHVQVDWSSFTEINLSHYEVERSTDGRNFITLGRVNAGGNSSTVKEYGWRDNISNEGIFFYRIKAVDADQRSIYSTIARVNISRQTTAAEIVLYPNPVMDKRITIQTGQLPAGLYKITVYDQAGRPVYQQSIDHGGGTITQQSSLPASLQPGVYRLSFYDGRDVKLTRSFLIQ